MPIKLMVWNVQFFSIFKIKDNSSPLESCLSEKRKLYFFKNIFDVNPDIFVLIENISNQGILGSLIEGNGALGAIEVLNILRTSNENWCLVPPLKLVDKIPTEEMGYYKKVKQIKKERNYTEGISVFFKKDKLDFTGPYIWPKTEGDNNNKRSKLAIENYHGISGEKYPSPWNNCLPDNNFFAGQYQFFEVVSKGNDNDGDVDMKNELNFPESEHRRPFLTRFKEKNHPGRTISLFSIHTSPKTAQLAVNNLSRINEIKKIDDNEVIVIAGDFNLDPRPQTKPMTFNNLGQTPVLNYEKFRLLKELDFEIHFKNKPTSYRSCELSSPFKDRTMLAENCKNEYEKEYFGYYINNNIWDNVLTRYGSKAQEPANHNPRVLDRVGIEQDPNFVSLMEDELSMFTNTSYAKLHNTIDNEGKLTLEGLKLFRAYHNYGHIGPPSGVSDHMALVIDI